MMCFAGIRTDAVLSTMISSAVFFKPVNTSAGGSPYTQGIKL